MALDGMIGRTSVAPVTARSDFLRVAIFLADGRVLDDRLFRLAGFSGQESVSTPFEFQLELRADTSERTGEPLTFAEIIGRPVTFGVRIPGADLALPAAPFAQVLSGPDAEGFSLFNGIAAGFAMAEPGVYTLSVKAGLWKLNLANRYEIHPQCNLRDAIARLLERHRIAFDMASLEGDDNLAVARIQDWMQAGESDYAFLQRLMAKAHLYYYFVHGPAGHTVVFANAPNYRPLFADGRRLRYTHTGAEQLGLEQDDVITQYSYEETLTASAVNGIFERQENAWEEDPVARFTAYQAVRPESQGTLPFHQYKIYQYGCDQGEAARFTEATASTLQSAGTQLSGGSRCARFRTGHRFLMGAPLGADVHPNPVRPSLEGRAFVITQVQHQAALDGSYQNNFQATEECGLITPFASDNTHQGSMLAKVVAGHDDGRHSTRWEYAYKTDFDPAQQTCEDRGSGGVLNAKGVYVQFSTPEGPSAPVFVKLAPHMQTVPEIGVTVLVSRANDESELPEIQSIIQSNGSKVVMPSGWTADTRVGSSFSTAYGDSKSVRFGRCSDVGPGDVDAAVNRIEEKYKSGRFKDASFSQGASYSYSTAEQGRGGILSDSESLGSTYSRQAAAETKSWSDVDFSYSESVAGTTESHSIVKQDSRSYQKVGGLSYGESVAGRTENVSTVEGDSLNRSTVMGASTSYNEVRGRSYSESVTAETESHVTTNGASRNVQVNHGATFSSSVVHGDATSLSTVTGTSSNTSTVGVQQQNSITGLAQSSTLTGASVSESVTGNNTAASLTVLSEATNVTGASMEMSITGASTRMSILGASIDLTLAGKTSSISMGGPGVEISFRQSFVCSSEPIKLSLPEALEMVL